MLPWFPIYAAETLSDERFQGWTVDERGAWFTLICMIWREGSITSDLSVLAKALHVSPKKMASIWSSIGDRFVNHPTENDRLTSKRLDAERQRCTALRVSRSEAGRQGAMARWEKQGLDYGNRIANARQPHAAAMAKDGDHITSQHITSHGKANGYELEGSKASKLLASIRAQIRPDLFERWYVPLKAESTDSTIRLVAPDSFHAQFVVDNYLPWLSALAAEVLGGGVTVTVEAG